MLTMKHGFGIFPYKKLCENFTAKFLWYQVVDGRKNGTFQHILSFLHKLRSIRNLFHGKLYGHRNSAFDFDPLDHNIALLGKE